MHGQLCHQSPNLKAAVFLSCTLHTKSGAQRVSNAMDEDLTRTQGVRACRQAYGPELESSSTSKLKTRLVIHNVPQWELGEGEEESWGSLVSSLAISELRRGGERHSCSQPPHRTHRGKGSSPPASEYLHREDMMASTIGLEYDPPE